MNHLVPANNVTALRARDYTPAQLDLIRRTVAADCDHDEFNLFVEVCRRVGLDPFRRQIYAVVYNKNKPEKRKMSIITGIDGFRAVAARCGDYRPDDAEPTIVYDAELKDPATNPLGIVKATYRAYKRDPKSGEWHAVVGTAHWDEFAPLDEVWEYDQAQGKKVPTGRFELGRTSKWRTMARVMIAKVAEAQAIRRGWPEDLSGVYAAEEMERATVIDATATEIVEQHQQQVRLAAVKAAHTIPLQWAPGEPIEFVADGQVMDRALAFIREAHPLQVNAWAEINAGGLREFWARHKADALDLKRAIEAKVKEFGADGANGSAGGADAEPGGTPEVGNGSSRHAHGDKPRAASDRVQQPHVGHGTKAGGAGPLFGKGS